ncbi:carboxylesterase/lipase family protein [Halopseudomonas sabulinigri]|uniref:Carboxylic ester hydrolase n=1 Tax=Halopseudomonas sabulinigri TaxID=472181 RepID=A0ABP9ZLS3_9GAMM
MKDNSSPTSTGFLLKTLTASMLAITLTGCLSSGGGSDDEATPDPLAVTTTEGDIKGVTIEGMRVFRGIPYAAAPVGELRFAPTAPAPERDETLELSDEFGSMCPQTNITTGAAQGEEDCLYLNVYTPGEAADLPVMVWIHGGAFVFGNGGGEYDPTRLVAEDVIVVTLNYRLGNLGFLAHPDLGNGDGNFGLMDQQQALRWVKENIEAFGGDPANVTVFGESAGGHSIMSHIVSPSAQAEDLFQRAIIQSGSYAPDQAPLAAAQAGGLAAEAAARAAGETCDDLTAAECFRALSVSQILALQGSQSIPTNGGTFLPRSIRVGVATGQYDNNLDILMGSNQDEGTLFVALDELTNSLTSLDAMGVEEYRDRVHALFAPYLAVIPYNTRQIADDYMARYDGNPSQLSLALSAVWTDYMFACNSKNQAATFAANNLDTFQYWFRDTNAPWTLIPPAVPVPGIGNVPISFPQGASHASEIPYVLYPEQLMRDRYKGTDEAVDTLAAEMVTYWTQFAKYGDPNASDGATTTWPQAGDSQVMQLNAPATSTATKADFEAYHWCDYWANPPLSLPTL